jgi:hypothetical protein
MIVYRTFLTRYCYLMATKIAIHWRKNQDPEPDPHSDPHLDPWVKGTDPRIRIRIRIRTKMSRIRNTVEIK